MLGVEVVDFDSVIPPFDISENVDLRDTPSLDVWESWESCGSAERRFLLISFSAFTARSNSSRVIDGGETVELA